MTKASGKRSKSVVRWSDLDSQVRDDLLEWFNVVQPDAVDKRRLAALFHAGKFHAWNCPECEDRVFWGEPDAWDHFQGVRQADYMSYPGESHDSPEEARCEAQLCDDCRRTSRQSRGLDLNLVGEGEPSCWA